MHTPVNMFLDMMESSVRIISMNVHLIHVRIEEIAWMVLTHTHVFVLVTMEVIVKMNVSKNDFFFQKYFIPTHSNTKGVYVVFSVFSFSRFQMGFSKNAECGFVVYCLLEYYYI